MVEYADPDPDKKGYWQSVPWEVAIKCGGIFARYKDENTCPSDPPTYLVNKGWRVRYIEVHVKFGEAILVDGSIFHAGHQGEGGEPNIALHISNDDVNEAS